MYISHVEERCQIHQSDIPLVNKGATLAYCSKYAPRVRDIEPLKDTSVSNRVPPQQWDKPSLECVVITHKACKHESY